MVCQSLINFGPTQLQIRKSENSFFSCYDTTKHFNAKDVLIEVIVEIEGILVHESCIY